MSTVNKENKQHNVTFLIAVHKEIRENLFPAVKYEIQIRENLFPRNTKNGNPRN